MERSAQARKTGAAVLGRGVIRFQNNKPDSRIFVGPGDHLNVFYRHRNGLLRHALAFTDQFNFSFIIDAFSDSSAAPADTTAAGNAMRFDIGKLTLNKVNISGNK